MGDPKSFMSDLSDTVSAAKASVSNAIDNAKFKATSAINSLTGQSNAQGGRGSAPASAYGNPYAHKSNTSDTTGANDPISLKTKFQPNILDNYDVVTYHWKLFITTPDASTSGKVLDPTVQTIIAESGVTDLTIDKVEIKAITTPSNESGTGVSTNFTFEIVEPSGAGFVDKLFYESIALGIGNWNAMPMYLQLQFRGRNPVDSEPESSTELGALKWLWPIKVTSMKANVSTVGTRYEVVAILYNDFALSNSISSTKHNVVLNNIETFGQAMVELEEKLNADQLLTLIDNYSIPDSYKIVVDPDIKGYKITSNTKNKDPRRADNFIKFDNKDAYFQASTSIDKIVDSLLAQTEEYQIGMKQSKTPGAEGVPIDQEATQIKPFWRIVTDTIPLQFDARRNDIAKEFVYYIVKYDLGVLEANVFQQATEPNTVAAERKRLMSYIDKKILKKKYSYIFTGLNDQILNLDLTVNNAYTTGLSRFGGIFQSTSMSDMGVVAQTHAADEAKVTKALSAAMAFQNNAKKSDATKVDALNAELQKSIDTAKLSGAETKKAEILQKAQATAGKLNVVNVMQRAGGFDKDGTLGNPKLAAQSLATPQSGLKFISDVNIKSQEAINAYTNFMKSASGKLRPVAFQESLQDFQVGLGVESKSNSGIQKLSNLFSVALHSSYDNSFANMNLTIKGDPFWLFPQPFADNGEAIHISTRGDPIDWIKKEHFRKEKAVNVNGSDNFFVIRFRTPRNYSPDETTDQPEPIDVETFSGVYKVTNIISKFDSGKFSQVLTAIIDPEIRMFNITDIIEEAAQQQDVPTKPSDLTADSKFPATAIKADKIMSDATDAIKGIQGQAKNLAGDIKAYGSDTIGQGIATAKSNIPTALNSVLPGLPTKFG